MQHPVGRIWPHHGLLGWVEASPSVDSGVPATVRTLLTGAFCQLGRMMIPIDPVDGLEDRWCSTQRGLMRRLQPFLLERLHGHPPISLLWTDDPNDAEVLFSSVAFPWELCGTIALIDPSADSPSDLGFSDWRVLLGRQPLSSALTTRLEVFDGLIAPGIDGDFVALFARTPALYGTFQQALERVCDRAGIQLVSLEERSFQQESGPTFERGT